MQQMHRATTTKQLMDQSKLFRFVFFGSIASICIGVICFIIFPFTKCYIRSCSWYYNPSYECINYGTVFCCNSYYSTYCGSNYCWPKPTSACLEWMIAGSSCMGLGGLLAIFVFIMFCNFRSKLRNGTAYLKMPAHQYPVYQQPIIVYSDQNQLQGQYPQYQQYVQQPQLRQEQSGNQINFSQRE